MHETIGRIANALYLDGQRPGGSGITKAAARDMARIAASAVTEPEHTPDVHHAADALREWNHGPEHADRGQFFTLNTDLPVGYADIAEVVAAALES